MIVLLEGFEDRPGCAPSSIRLGGRRVGVAALVDRWDGADHTYLKLLGDDDDTYLLRRQAPSGEWELVLLEARRRG